MKYLDSNQKVQDESSRGRKTPLSILPRAKPSGLSYEYVKKPSETLGYSYTKKNDMSR